jgi:hypothetical protein
MEARFFLAIIHDIQFHSLSSCSSGCGNTDRLELLLFKPNIQLTDLRRFTSKQQAGLAYCSPKSDLLLEE